MVMPRAFSSGALSIWSYAVYCAWPFSANTLVIAAVSDVLPWSTCPIVPTLQCGLVRSNFSLAIGLSVQVSVDAISDRSRELLLHFRRHVGRRFRVMIELHGEGGAPLGHGAQVVDVAEHVGERHHRVDDVGVAAHVLALDLAAPRVEVADDGAGVVFRRHHLDLHDRLEQNR